MAANQYFQLTIANAFSNLNTIYTEDVAAGNTLASTLELQIRNTSGENLSFKPLTGDPTEQNHHFKLQFWADTLGDITVGNISPGKLNPGSAFGFRMSTVTPNALGGYNYYFIAEDMSNPWLPNQTITLELARFLAKPPTGKNWDPTKKISLDGKDLLNASSKLISASQLSLSSNIVVSNILNNVQLPLHLSLQDLDTLPDAKTPGTGASVLNNGTASDLTLSVVNMALPDDGSLTTNGVLKFDKNSRIAISFDVQGSNETKDWAIGKADDLLTITPRFPSGWTTDNEQEESTGNGKITWTFKPASNQGALLNSLEEMLITIPGIKTMLPSGIANLYFSYQNVPNYGNGSFIVPVQKSPLVTRGQSVGIGTNAPGATLDVHGDVLINNSLTVDGIAGVNNKLTVGSPNSPDTNLTVNGRLESIDGNGGGMWVDSLNTRFVGAVDSRIGFWNTDWRLTVDSAGKVEIPGTLTVGSPNSPEDINLTVNGRLKSIDGDRGGMWVDSQNTRFVGAVDSRIGFWNKDWRLTVDSAGKVEIPGTLDAGALNVQDGLTVSGGTTLNGDVTINKQLLFNTKPILYKTYSLSSTNKGNHNEYFVQDTKLSAADYIGIVTGYFITGWDWRDTDNRHDVYMYIGDSGGNGNLWFSAQFPADQDGLTLQTTVVFIPKIWMRAL